jgi:hypothetical protein
MYGIALATNTAFPTRSAARVATRKLPTVPE